MVGIFLIKYKKGIYIYNYYNLKKDENNFIYHGRQKFWYKDGVKKKELNYVDGKKNGYGKMVTYPFNDYISDVKLLPFDHTWLLFASLEITGYWFDDYPNNVKITGFKDKDGNSITFTGRCHEKPFLSPGFFLLDCGVLEQKNSQFSGSFKDFRKHGHGCESIQIFEENTIKSEVKKMNIFNILDGKFDMGLKQGKFIQNVDETYEKVNYLDDQLLDDDLFSLDCNFDNLD